MNVDQLLVAEVIDWTEDPRGLHGIYRLRRGNLRFEEAVRLFEERCAIRNDRMAWTGAREGARFLSIEGAPHLHPVPGARLELVGHARRPLSKENQVANEFSVRVRSVTRAELELLPERLAALARHGVPNYFDDRTPRDGFAARDLLRGRPDAALEKISATAPGDALGATSALARLPAAVRREVVLDYQRFLWNRLVARFLRLVLGRGVRVSAGDRVTHDLAADEDGPRLPARVALPRAGVRFAPRELARAATAALAAERLDVSKLSIEKPRGFPFARGSRPLVLRPAELHLSGARPEPRRPNRALLRVSFRLPLDSSPQPVLEHLFAAKAKAPGRARPARA